MMELVEVVLAENEILATYVLYTADPEHTFILGATTVSYS